METTLKYGILARGKGGKEGESTHFSNGASYDFVPAFPTQIERLMTTIPFPYGVLSYPYRV